MRRILVLLLFLLSGAAGLVYQVVWMRQLTLIVGVTSQAVATVLAVFMGGLALGSWLLGRAGDETRSPLRFYGWLELGIALFGVQSLLLLGGILESYGELKAWSDTTLGPRWFPAVRVAISCAALLGPTTLMGATLPVLIKGVCRTKERIARASGLLYGINTLGAVAGTLAAAFWLVEHYGIRGTTFVAAGTNLAVGILALGLARFEKEPASEPVPMPAAEDEPPLEPAPLAVAETRGTARVVVLAFGVSGFLALAYEVLWTRYLIYVLGENSVYAFSAMLASFLVGIALGSFLAALVADHVRNRVALLGTVLVLLGASAATTVTMMGFVSDDATSRMGSGPFWEVTVRQFAKSLAILIIPTTLSGSTFAIVARVFARDLASLGRDAGRAYAVNTFGAIGGALAGGFLILPHLGLVRGLMVLAAVNVLLGLALLLRRGPRGRAVKTAVFTGLIAAAAFLAIPLYAVSPEELLERRSSGEIVYYADGPESSVAVQRLSNEDLWILVDGEEQSGTDRLSQIHLRLLGHLPALFHPDPKTGLVVAFGGGITTGSLLQHPLEAVDQVELNRKVIEEAATFFAPFNHDPTSDPRFTPIYEDGRQYLLATRKRYDVITSDPIDPNDAGVTNLYSKEYYELVRAHLNDGGVACQWITNGYGEEGYKALLRAFQSVFPNTSIWHAGITTVVVGLKDAPAVSLEDLRAKFEIEPVAASLAYVGIDSPETLLSLMLAGPRGVYTMLWDDDPSTPEPVNTDNRPVIEYHRSSGGAGMREWGLLAAARSPDLGDWVAGWSEADLAACEPAYAWMEDYLFPSVLASMDVPGGDAAESPDTLARAIEASFDRVIGKPSEERPADSAVLSEARERELGVGLGLGAMWELLGQDVAPVYLVMSGLPVEEPGADANAEQRRLYEAGMGTALAAYRAGELESAGGAFRAVADTVPGAPRAALLAAACYERTGDPIAALGTVLAIDQGGGIWNPMLAYARPLVDLSFAAMDASGADREALGRRLLELMPRDADRPAERPRSVWGTGADAPWPPRDLPSGDAVRDSDAWRLWWSEAGWAVKAHDGRFVWRYDG